MPFKEGWVRLFGFDMRHTLQFLPVECIVILPVFVFLLNLRTHFHMEIVS